MTIDECVFSFFFGASWCINPSLRGHPQHVHFPFWVSISRETHPSLADEGDQNLDAAGEHADAFWQSSAGWTGLDWISDHPTNQIESLDVSG